MGVFPPATLFSTMQEYRSTVAYLEDKVFDELGPSLAVSAVRILQYEVQTLLPLRAVWALLHSSPVISKWITQSLDFWSI